jgi:hypothetical protein
MQSKFNFKETYTYIKNYINSLLGIRGARLLYAMSFIILTYYIYYFIIDSDTASGVFDFAGIPEIYVWYTFLTIIFVAGLYLMVYLVALPKPDKDINFEPTPTSQVFKLLAVIVTFLIFFYVLYAISGNVEFITLNNLYLLLGTMFGLALIYSIYKDVFKKGGLVISEADDSYVAIIKNIIFYVPCLIIDLVEFVQKELNLTPATSYYLLIIEAIIIVLYFFGEFLGNFFINLITHDAKTLVNEPVYLTTSQVIGSYPTINPKKDYQEDADERQQDYSYALSSWVNINPQYGFDDYKTILDYGGKPLIEYKGQTNTLRIKVKSGNDNENIVYENNEFKLQKWNHFVINVYEDMVDIHLNGNLIVSEKYDVSTWSLHQSIKVGDNEGLEGGICNVKYFNHPLSKPTISFLYHIFKDKNPPVL